MVKGYRFTNGRLDRRPLGLEDIPSLPMPFGMTNIENNTDFLAVLHGTPGTRAGYIGPNPLTDTFYLTSFHLYAESTDEFLNGGLRMTLALTQDEGTILRPEIFSPELSSLLIGVLWTFGWNVHFPFPINIPSGSYIRLSLVSNAGAGTSVDYFPSVAGFYE